MIFRTNALSRLFDIIKSKKVLYNPAFLLAYVVHGFISSVGGLSTKKWDGRGQS
jgi:hypothetical protein